MNLWKRTVGLVLGPSGRGLLTGDPGCCCGGTEPPPNCDCRIGPGGCYNAGATVCRCKTGTWRFVSGQGVLSNTSLGSKCPQCCGPVAGQRFRFKRVTKSYYGNTAPCQGQINQEVTTTILFNGTNHILHQIIRQALSVCGPLVVTSDISPATPIPICGNSSSSNLNYFSCTPGNPLAVAAVQGGGTLIGASGNWSSTATSYSGNLTLDYDNGARFVSVWQAVMDMNNAGCLEGPECTQACCLPNGDCVEALTSLQCLGIGGIPAAVGVNCYRAGCDGVNARDKGACCDPATGDCVMSGPDQCVSPRVFKGIGTACAFGTCPQPTGNCCKDGGCTIKTLADCNLSGGTWGGPGTNCSNPNTCASPGACCTTQFGCLDLLPQACTDLGGVFQGPGTLCAGTVCTGACCNQTGHGFDCQQSTPQGCAGTFYGLGSSCFPSPCGVIPPRPAGTGAFR